MTDREILQIVGAKLGCTLADLFDYYQEQSQQAIRKAVRGLVSAGYLRFAALESNGLYLTPEGLRVYDS